MTKIIAMGASNSSQSINKKLAKWAANQIEADVEVLDLNDYEMPIYSVDRQKQDGFPEEAQTFKEKIRNADGIVISFAEYNGSYSSAFKNIVDWISRIEKEIWSNKPMFLMATSPGPRGGLNVLGTAEKTFPFQGGKVSGVFSLPSFHSNFNDETGIVEGELLSAFSEELKKFEEEVKLPQEV